MAACKEIRNACKVLKVHKIEEAVANLQACLSLLNKYASQ
jgi:hypothetical protein